MKIVSLCSLLIILCITFGCSSNKHMNEWVNEDGYYYYYDSTGHKLIGKWQKDGEDYYYLDNEGKMAKSTWIKDSYVDESGKMLKDCIREIDGKNYIFDIYGSGKPYVEVVSETVQETTINKPNSNSNNKIKWDDYSNTKFTSGMGNILENSLYELEYARNLYLNTEPNDQSFNSNKEYFKSKFGLFIDNVSMVNNYASYDETYLEDLNKGKDIIRTFAKMFPFLTK